MTWNGLEVVKMLAVLEGAANRSPGDMVMLVGSCAVELVAARGGTMTAETIRVWADVHPESQQVLQHIAAQGARLAVTEARLPVEMKDCTIIFKECLKGHGRLTATNWVDRGCPVCERDNARTSEGVWRKRLEAVAEALEDVAPGELGRLDVLNRVKRLKAKMEALQAAGAVLSAHVDKTAGGAASFILDGSGPAPVLSLDDPPRLVACMKYGPIPDLGLTQEQREAACREEGAEAMRAACCEAVDSQANYEGMSPAQRKSLKAAIEGATP